jgi:hypothetical protein
MNTTTTDSVPARLERLRQRFERWRQTHPPRSRIGDGLWAAAVKAVGIYGLYRTARALRVNYYALQKRLEGESGISLVSRQEKPSATFVELPSPVSADSLGRASGSCECTLELEDAGEVKLRLHFPAVAATDLAVLCQSLRGRSA